MSNKAPPGRSSSSAANLKNRLIPKQQILNHTVTMHGTFKKPLAKTRVSSLVNKSPALPPLQEVQPVKPTNATTEEDENLFSTAFKTMKDPFDFIEYAQKNNLTKEYVYLKPTKIIEDAEHPTNLQIIDSQEAERDEFWTLSLDGITHVKGSTIDFVKLDEWLKNIEAFRRLMQIPFFKLQRQWRCFKMWKSHVQKGKVTNSRGMLTQELFFADKILRPAFNQVQRQICEIQNIKLFMIRSDGMYTLDQFTEENAAYRNQIAKKFEEFYVTVLKIVQEACERTVDTLNSPDDDKSKKMSPLEAMMDFYERTHTRSGQPINGSDQTNNLSYTAKASHKAVCQRLVRFIRLIDYAVIGALRNICFTSLLEQFSVLKNLHDRGARKIQYQAEEPLEDINPSIEYSRVYEIIKQRTAEMFEAPIFRVDVSYENGLIFTPTNTSVVERIDTVRNEFIDILFKVPRLIINPIFIPYHASDSEGIATIPENITMPDLGQIIFNDSIFKETTTKQNMIVQGAYEMLKFFSTNYQTSIDIYENNMKFDLSFMNEPDCTSVEIRAKFDELRIQEHMLRKIVDKSDVGLFCIYTGKMKSLFLTSPGRCTSMIRAQIPSLIKKNLVDFETKIRKAHAELISPVEDVPSFVDYIHATERYREEFKEFQKKSDVIKSFFALANEHGIYLPAEYQENFQELQPTLESIKSILGEARDKREELMPKFVKMLDEEIAELHAKVKEVKELAESPELYVITTRPQKAAQILVVLMARTDQLKYLASSYNGYQVAMSLPKQRFDDVTELSKLTSYQQLLWETRMEWAVRTSKWLTENFMTIDPDEMRESIAGFRERADKAAAGLNDNIVADHLREMISEYENLIPAIVSLKNPALKGEHKEKIDLLLGDGLFAKEQYSLQKLYDLQAFNYVEQIAEITAQASNEQTLLDLLQSVKDGVEQMQFNVTQSKFSKTAYYLGGIEEILYQIEDMKATIYTVRASHYVSQLRASADEWMKTLRSFSSVMTKIKRCQELWEFMYSVIQAGDIQRNLPNNKDMTNVDKIWKGIGSRANDDPVAIHHCLVTQINSDLDQSIDILEKLQKAVYSYLEVKRTVFPRLYFISDEEFIQLIINSKDPLALRPYMKLLFDSIDSYEIALDNHVPCIVAVTDAAGEKLTLRPIKYKSAVEQWLQNIEEFCQRALKNEVKTSNTKYTEMVHEDWVDETLNQGVFLLSQIKFCDSINLAFSADNVNYALTNILNETIQRIEMYSNFIKVADLTQILRFKIHGLLLMLCRHREITDMFIKKQYTSANNPIWQSEIRFKFDENDKDIIAMQRNFEIKYGYEYLGTSPRYPITPLTHNYFNYITNALQCKLMCNIMGITDMGKISTVHELARMYGYYFFVHNCSSVITLQQITSMIRGIVQAGVWGCFADLDRIDPDILSIIGEHVIGLREANLAGTKKYIFHGNEISINHSYALFMTSEPGYPTRHELPTNFRAMLRTIAISEPDVESFSRIILSSYGIKEAADIAHTIAAVFRLSNFNNSSPYGIRFTKMLCTLVLDLMYENPDANPYTLVATAMDRCGRMVFTKEKFAIFKNVISEFFPGIEVIKLNENDPDAANTVAYAIEEAGFIPTEDLIKTVMTMHQFFIHNTNIIITGDHSTGKSTIVDALEALYNYFHKVNPTFREVEKVVIYPNALGIEDLFGRMENGMWQVGHIEHYLDIAINSDKQTWLVFNGKIEPHWIENFNTALDSNKIMCFANSRRIKIPPYVHFIFISSSLEDASPPTLSLMCIINTHKDLIHPQQIVENLTKKYIEPLFEKCPKQVAKFKELCETISLAKDFIEENKEYAKVINFVQSIKMFFNLFIATVGETKFDDLEGTASMSQCFVFAFAWTFGGFFDENKRSIFDNFVKDVFNNLAQIPNRGVVFDWYLDEETKEWRYWPDHVPSFIVTATSEFELSPHNVKSYNVIVPTLETERIEYMLIMLLKSRINTVLHGPAGCGKTLVINEVIQKLDKEYHFHEAHFTPNSSRDEANIYLKNTFHIKNGAELYPHEGKHGVIYIEGFGAPKPNQYGFNQLNEMMREIMKQKGFHQKTPDFIYLRDISLLGVSTQPKPADRLSIDPAVSNCVFNITMIPADNTIQYSIINSILNVTFREYSDSVRSSLKKLAAAIVSLFEGIENNFVDTPDTPLVSFNLHDIGHLIQSILKTNKEINNSTHALERFFVHEACRVFQDKLYLERDQKKFREMFENILKKKLGTDQSMNQLFGSLYGALRRSVQANEEPQIYLEYHSLDDIIPVLEDVISDYQYSRHGNSNNIIIVDHLALHIQRLTRMMRMPRSHALLIGPRGCGKRTAAKITSFIIDADYYEVENQNLFKEDLKNLMFRCGINNRKFVLLINETQTHNPAIMSIADRLICGVGLINMFTQEEHDKICNDLVNYAKKSGKSEAYNQLIGLFIERLHENMHIIITTYNDTDTIRQMTNKYTSLERFCSIDYYDSWPENDVQTISAVLSESVDDESKEETKLLCINTFIYKTAEYYAEYMTNNLGGLYAVTPFHLTHFSSTYQKVLKMFQAKFKKEMLNINVARTKLKNAEFTILDLKNENEEINKKLDASKNLNSDVQATLDKFIGKADKIKAHIKEDEESLEKDTRLAKTILKEIQITLKPVSAPLQDAIVAIKTCTQKQIEAIISNGPTPASVSAILDTLCAFMETDQSWRHIQAILTDPMFVTKIANKYGESRRVPPNVMNKLETAITKNSNFSKEQIPSSLTGLAMIYDLIVAQYNYETVIQNIIPKQQKYQQIAANLRAERQKIQQKTRKLQSIEDKIEEIRAQNGGKGREFEEAINKLAINKQKIENYEKLRESLQPIIDIWDKKAKTIEEEEKFTFGHSILSAMYFIYMGPFPEMIRQKFLKDVIDKCKELEIPVSPNFMFEKCFIDQTTIDTWTSMGLPGDKASIENAVIIKYGPFAPYIVDPDSVVHKWIENIEAVKQLTVMKVGAPNYQRTIEISARADAPILLRDAGDHLDPIIDALLQRKPAVQDGKYQTKIGDRTIEVDEGFMLYITTPREYAPFIPELYQKTIIVNFQPDITSFRHYSIDMLLKSEQSTLLDNRNSLREEIMIVKKSIMQRVDKVLELFKSSNANSLIEEQVLQTALKEMSEQIVNDQNLLSTYESEMDSLKSKVAEYDVYGYIISIMMNMMYQLHSINSLLVFQRDSFGYWIKEAISKVPDIKDREEKLKMTLVETIFHHAAEAMEPEIRNIFAFMVAVEVDIMHGNSTHDELRMFLNITGSMPKFGNPLPATISEISWSLLSKACEEIPNISHWAEKVSNNPAIIAAYLTPSSKFEPQLDNTLFEGLTLLQKLIVIRFIKYDALAPALKEYIEHVVGKGYFVTDEVVRDPIFTNPDSMSMPMMLIMNKISNEARDQVKLYAKQATGMDKVIVTAPDPSQPNNINDFLQECSATGGIVYIQNLHRHPEFAADIISMIPKLRPEFKVVVSAKPHPKLIKLAGLSLKVPYTSLEFREAMLILANMLPENIIKHTRIARIVYVLMLFHAQLMIRGKMWSNLHIKYEIGLPEWDILVSNINELTADKDVTFTRIRKMAIHDVYQSVLFGGYDMHRMKELLNTAITDEIEKPNGSVFGFSLPRKGGLDAIINMINEHDMNGLFYDLQSPFNERMMMRHTMKAIGYLERVGLRPHFERELFQNSHLIIKKIRTMIPTIDEIGGEEDVVNFSDPMMLVIKRETDRLRQYIYSLAASVDHLYEVSARNIKYETQDVIDCTEIISGKIPMSWNLPNTSPMFETFFAKINERANFFNMWIRRGAPVSLMFDAFMFPHVLIRAIIRKQARSLGVVTTVVGIIAKVLPSIPETKPEVGQYITNLGLIGAKLEGDQLVGSNNDEPTHLKCLHLIPTLLSDIPHEMTRVPIYSSRAAISVSEWVTGRSFMWYVFVDIKDPLPASFAGRPLSFVISN